jgi:lipopolysaccharide biosynthesis glycosyltransferase
MEPAASPVRSLEVVTAVDEAYVLPLLVALMSLRAHLPRSVTPRLHLLHRGLAARHLDAISRVVDLEPVLLEPALVDRVPRHATFPPEAAAPLLLDAVLPPELDRILFLDADTLVLDDVSPLATVDLEDAPFAAVADAAVPRCSSPRGVRHWAALGIPHDVPYLNAGVLVVSIGAWREERISQRALAYLGRGVDRRGLLHQDALNATAWSRWARLPERWNVPSFAGRPFGPAIPAHPAIVHFAGRFKPWRIHTGSPFAPVYASALEDLGATLPRGLRPLRARVLGAYDQRLRRHAYPLEHALWQRRLI